jgi:hypothetical protein
VKIVFELEYKEDNKYWEELDLEETFDENGNVKDLSYFNEYFFQNDICQSDLEIVNVRLEK